MIKFFLGVDMNSIQNIQLSKIYKFHLGKESESFKIYKKLTANNLCKLFLQKVNSFRPSC